MGEEEVEFIVVEGRRFVVPYYRTFVSHAKGRWIGRTLLEVFSNDFIAFPPGYYRDAITQGKLIVNGKHSTCDYLFRNGDEIRHTTHIHEPSALDCGKIKILKNTGDLIAVDKPASYPVYNCGLYKYNTVVEHLKEYHDELKDQKLFPLHRLDRVVSGVLLFTTCSAFAKRFSKLMIEKKVQKYYISRVHGRFQEGETIVDKPIGMMDDRTGVNSVDAPSTKEAKTVFNFLSYSPELDQSIILCKPLTGRSHQLRVHLSYLGNPIIGDRMYSLDQKMEYTRPSSMRHPVEYEKDSICSSCKEDTEKEINQTNENDIQWDQIYLHAYFYSIKGEDAFTCRSQLPQWSQLESFSPPLTTSDGSIHPLLEEIS